jgi:hypothetical protein
VVIELERDADDIVAFTFEQPGHNGGIDAAGHGDDDTRVLRACGKVKAVHVIVPKGCDRISVRYAGNRPVRQI